MKHRLSSNYILINCLVLVLALSCIPLFKGVQSMRNLEAPDFTGLSQPDKNSLILSFNQLIESKIEDFISHGGFSLVDILVNEENIEIHIENADDPGREYFIEGKVYDQNNNALWFMIPFYGYNNNPARPIISEFIVEHSSNRYEKVELYIMEGGNLGGLTIYNGAAGQHKAKHVFASQEVVSGEFLVVHFRSLDGKDTETGQINEYGHNSEVLNLASSPNAIDHVRDFWADGGQGLSDTNGAISIYTSPARGANLIDAVLYSNRSFDPEASYGSFGTSYTWKVVQEIYDMEGWVSNYDTIRPEDCLRTDDSTSTRSLNRDRQFSDNNIPEDWHIVQTGMSSFGSPNSEDVYEK